jgi:hypothetical protein
MRNFALLHVRPCKASLEREESSMPSPFDLAQLADLKTWLDIQSSDDDPLLGRLITQVSRAILSHIDRAMVLPAPFVETHDGDGGSIIVLQQWPVNAITSCSVNGVAIAAAAPLAPGQARASGYVLEPAQTAPPGRMQRLSLRGSWFQRGVQNVSIAYQAGYQVTGESALVPFTAPYEILAEAPYGDWASDVGVVYANGVALTAVSGAPAAGQYSVAGGVYTFAAADLGAAVRLSYGYVPADLGFCCLDWAAELYAYRARIGQNSKSLGGQETSSFIVKDIPDFVATALQPFKRVVMP